MAHFFAPPGYVWTEHTISELAAQGHIYKWIMQAGFIGFGLLLGLALVWKSNLMGRIHSPDLPILVYGLAILVTGIYCTAPFDPNISYSIQEAQLHSYFATLAGFALVGGTLWYLIASPEKRSIHLVFLVLITAASMLFGLAESGTIPIGKGIVQRSLYLVSFIWLAFTLRKNHEYHYSQW